MIAPELKVANVGYVFIHKRFQYKGTDFYAIKRWCVFN